LGEKEALEFLKKSNKSILAAWESYRLQIGNSQNKQLNDVFKQMFKAWTLSNQKAIALLEDKQKPVKKSPNSKEKKPVKK
jgi:DNA modification methylase